MHRQPDERAFSLLDLHLALRDIAHQGGVAVEDREVPLRGGQHDRGRTAGEEGLFGRDDLHAEDAVGH